MLFVADPAVSCTAPTRRGDGRRTYFEERLARFVARRHRYDGVLLGDAWAAPPPFASRHPPVDCAPTAACVRWRSCLK